MVNTRCDPVRIRPSGLLLVSTTFWLRPALEMMQNGTRTSKFGMRCEEFCFWCMSFIFVEFMAEDDGFGKIHLPAKISGLQMFLQWFLDTEAFEMDFDVVCQLYVHVGFSTTTG